MSCKKGGFVNLRHNEIRDIIAHLLNEVCKDVSVEPRLLKMNGERLSNKTSKANDEGSFRCICYRILDKGPTGIL